jgi:hypothetical protein
MYRIEVVSPTPPGVAGWHCYDAYGDFYAAVEPGIMSATLEAVAPAAIYPVNYVNISESESRSVGGNFKVQFAQVFYSGFKRTPQNFGRGFRFQIRAELRCGFAPQVLGQGSFFGNYLDISLACLADTGSGGNLSFHQIYKRKVVGLPFTCGGGTDMKCPTTNVITPVRLIDSPGDFSVSFASTSFGDWTQDEVSISGSLDAIAIMDTASAALPATLFRIKSRETCGPGCCCVADEFGVISTSKKTGSQSCEGALTAHKSLILNNISYSIDYGGLTAVSDGAWTPPLFGQPSYFEKGLDQSFSVNFQCTYLGHPFTVDTVRIVAVAESRNTTSHDRTTPSNGCFSLEFQGLTVSFEGVEPGEFGGTDRISVAASAAGATNVSECALERVASWDNTLCASPYGTTITINMIIAP